MKINKPTPAGAVLAGVALVLSLALVPAALAKGKPGGGGTSGSSTISGPVMVTDRGTPGLSWGDTVTFNVSTTATAQPFVHLVCSGNGVGYDTWKGVFAGSLDTDWNF